MWGKTGLVEESDIPNLKYLQALLKETLRMYPVGPLLVPHEAMEDCDVGGYFVPRGTGLFINAWTIQRDPNVWAEPDRFQPERFLTTNVDMDVKGQSYELLPFGSGRRSCPGIGLALQVMHLTLARILQAFELKTNPGCGCEPRRVLWNIALYDASAAKAEDKDSNSANTTTTVRLCDKRP
ncbi:hypothetical protein Syun_002148 [Stephania yunnanensis]|uniref:Cytochrome P450 n=1 Tax=Stephania yunnanensis TaxID=152371 RepID=A0AAP0LEY9_9MAGN